MVSIRQFYSFSNSKALSRAEKYKIYLDKDNIKFILGLNVADGGKEYYNHFPEISNALIDAIDISNTFPRGSYNSWTNEVKENADHEAIIYYNKYGHLGIADYQNYILSHSLKIHYIIPESYDFFLPLSNNKEHYSVFDNEVYKKTTSKRTITQREIRKITKILCSNDSLKDTEKLKLEAKLAQLYENDEKLQPAFFDNISFTSSIKQPMESMGEPIYMFYDLIWFLARCLESWDRYLREKPNLYSRYIPSKNDDLLRMVEGYDFPFNQVEEYIEGHLIDDYGYVYKTESIIHYEGIKRKYVSSSGYLNWPLWKDVLDYYGQRFVINLETKFDKSTPIMEYDAESLYQLLYLSILTDVEKDFGREYRMCKNPNCSNFVYSVDKRKKLYCSPECASAHNSYKTRQRKSGKEVKI